MTSIAIRNDSWSPLVGLAASVVYATLIVGVAAARSGFAPIEFVAMFWLVTILFAAPFIIGVGSQTRSMKATLPVILSGTGAVLAQTHAYASLVYLATTQMLVLAFSSSLVIFLWRYSPRRSHCERKDSRATPVVFTMLCLLSLAGGFGVGAAIGNVTGEAAAKHLTDEQLILQLTSNDMQRRWDVGWYLASERPDLLVNAVLDSRLEVSQRAIEAIQRFKVENAVIALERISKTDPEPERQDAALRALKSIGTLP